MNVLFVVDSLRLGGAGRVVSILANEYAARGNKVSVVSFFSSEVNYYLDKGIEFHSFVNTANDVNEDSFYRRIKRLKRTCNDFHTDILVSFITELNVYSIIASINCRWVTIISERNNPAISPNDKRLRLLRDIFYRYADGYVFQTDEARAYFNNSISKRSVVIPNPISDELPAPYTGSRKEKIVSVGRLTAQKNYPLAIKAVSKIIMKHPNYTYEIYGDGEEKQELIDLIADLGMTDRIVLMGHRTDVYSCIENASVFLMSSDYEGMSNALIEALALGLPVVSTDHPIGGARALIRNGHNGLLVPVNDECAIINAVNTLIENRDLADLFSTESIAIRTTLSRDRICSMWDDYISSF